MTFLQRVSVGVLVAVTAATPVFAQGQDVTASTVLARVGETEITLGHLIAAREMLPAQFRTLPDEALFGGLLDQLIEQTVLAEQLEEPLTRRELLERDNERRGIDANIQLSRIARAAVTDEALQAAYGAQYGGDEPSPEFNASHILVSTPEEAEEIAGLLEAGGDFATLARERSGDGAAMNGGELGWFGLGMMVEPFENAVVDLEVGQVSEPVQTQFGFHLVRLNDRRMSEPPTLDSVRQELSDQIQRQRATEVLATLAASEGVERFTDGVSPSVLSRADLLE